MSVGDNRLEKKYSRCGARKQVNYDQSWHLFMKACICVPDPNMWTKMVIWDTYFTLLSLLVCPLYVLKSDFYGGNGVGSNRV